LDEKVMTAADADKLDAAVKKEVDEAIQFARDSEYPQPTEALERVFA
jgi:TPP-dependent pyruvate/acetoin dehydrogenase alpha subunit